MTIQIANNALENCYSIEQVVRLINDDFVTDAPAETVAAAYAIKGAKQAGYGFDDINLEAQMDALVGAGAEFCYAEAMEIAVSAKKP